MNQKVKYFYWLDTLRFISALAVVVCHARASNWVSWDQIQESNKNVFSFVFFSITRLSIEWVVLFFVLSGFLVGGKAVELACAGGFNSKTYVLDRVTRIYPPLVQALFWSAIIAMILHQPITIKDFFGNLLGFQGVFVNNFAENGPLWSMAYEIWFYVLTGGFACVISSSGGAMSYVIVFVCLIIFAKLKIVFLISLALGIIAYNLIGRVSVRIFFIGCILAVVGVVLSQLQKESLVTASIFPSLDHFARDIAYLIESLGLALILPFSSAIVPKSHYAARLDALGASLSKFSYTLYLTHSPTIELWKAIFPQRFDNVSALSTVLFFAKIILACSVAWLLYLTCEAHTHRWRFFLKRVVADR